MTPSGIDPADFRLAVPPRAPHLLVVLLKLQLFTACSATWGPHFIINILTAIVLAPGGSSPVHIYREHYIEYTNNTQNT